MLIPLKWLMVCLVIAMVMKPLFPLKSLKVKDGGFSVSLGLGSGILCLSVWFVCALTHLPFDTVLSIVGIVFFALIFLVLRKKGRIGNQNEKNIANERKRFLIGFAVFSLLFIAAFWVKGFKPLIDHQTEQYMDYGLMNAMYRQKRVPFEDMWFALKKVNYYYLGQAAAVVLCRLAFVTPEYGYNLMLCTIFSLLLLSVFCLVEAFLSGIDGMKRTCSVTGGIMGALMCTCGGNGHWILYGIIRPIYEKINRISPQKSYWFPTSTLFIGYDPDTLDKAKHEFPAYTLILGDLHAHVLNMMFTIPFLILLFDLVLTKDDTESVSGKSKDEELRILLREIFDLRLVLLGLILGLFKGVNYWDFPIFFVVAGAVILFCDIKRSGFSLWTVITVLLKGLFIYTVGAVAMFPFTKDYINPSSGIRLCDRHSPIDKLAVIWAVHVFIILSLLIYVFMKRFIGRRKGRAGNFTYHELIIIAVSLCGLGLLLVPEIVYVKDIYGDEFQRYNTMFKLTFQGFILLSISAGICIGLFLKAAEESRLLRVILKSAGVIYCTAALVLSVYMGWSVRAWFGNIFDASLRKGISASEFILDDPKYDGVREAIDILNSDTNRRLHIIEEAGNSYKPESRLSVFTGAVTVAGWYVHEWVWRNDSDAIRLRHEAVRNFYSCGDEEYCRKLVEKFDLDYIYVGPETVEKYAVDYAGFTHLGEHVWESTDGRYMLIKVN